MDVEQRFLFVLGSTRVDGNSERLARAAAAHLPVGATARWERLIDDPLPPFFDTRHSTGYGAPGGAGLRWVEATLAATSQLADTCCALALGAAERSFESRHGSARSAGPTAQAASSG